MFHAVRSIGIWRVDGTVLGEMAMRKLLFDCVCIRLEYDNFRDAMEMMNGGVYQDPGRFSKEELDVLQMIAEMDYGEAA